ncbi:MAG: hypothetical protein ACJAV1_003332, partial [Paraglaciecola sp.]
SNKLLRVVRVTTSSSTINTLGVCMFHAWLGICVKVYQKISKILDFISIK